MKILILGAGVISGNGDQSIWLAEQGGLLLVEKFAAICEKVEGDAVFVVRAEDLTRRHIGNVISQAAPGAKIVSIDSTTQGAPCTVLLCIGQIDMDGELLILNSNELINFDYAESIKNFRERKLDVGLVTFPSLHPRYSYVAFNEEGNVEEAAEKRPISRHALAGYFWFARGSDLITAIQEMIRKDAHVEGQFYLSLVLNELVLKQKKIGTLSIDSKQYQPLKTRRQVEQYEAEGEEWKQ